MAYDIKAKFTKNSPLPCWTKAGYIRKPGTKKGEPGSCYKPSPTKKYVSDAQRKAVWASKADGGKGNPNKMKKSSALKKISAACKSAAKRKFKVWPSAYASGWGVRCTKAGGPSRFGGGKKKKK